MIGFSASPGDNSISETTRLQVPRSPSRTSLHRSTHSLQILTPDPEASPPTSARFLPQKLHFAAAAIDPPGLAGCGHWHSAHRSEPHRASFDASTALPRRPQGPRRVDPTGAVHPCLVARSCWLPYPDGVLARLVAGIARITTAPLSGSGRTRTRRRTSPPCLGASRAARAAAFPDGAGCARAMPSRRCA